VQKGEVLYRIGLKYKVPWQELAQYNKLKNPNLIFPGQIILIPTK
jgi:LysM repeat protein